jgi:hypothetical protein
MDFPTFQTELRRIGGAVHAFAAIGAALRLYQAKQQADPAVQARLLAAVEAVLRRTRRAQFAADFRCSGVRDLPDRRGDRPIPHR